MFDGNQEPDGSTVIEQIDCKFFKPDDLSEFVNRVGQVDEGVFVFTRGRARGIAKPWIVGRDNVELVGNEGDQIAEGVRARAWPWRRIMVGRDGFPASR